MVRRVPLVDVFKCNFRYSTKTRRTDEHSLVLVRAPFQFFPATLSSRLFLRKNKKSQVLLLFFLQCSLDKDVIQRKTCSDLGIFGRALVKSLPCYSRAAQFCFVLWPCVSLLFFFPPPAECWPLLTICLVTPTTFFCRPQKRGLPSEFQ